MAAHDFVAVSLISSIGLLVFVIDVFQVRLHLQVIVGVPNAISADAASPLFAGLITFSKSKCSGRVCEL